MSEEQVYQFSDEVRKILEGSGLAFSVLQIMNDGYRAILVSDGACRLFGAERGPLMQYLSNKSYKRVHPDDAGKLIEASDRFRTRDENTIVCRMMLNGAYRPLMFHEHVYHTGDGPDLYFCSYYDLENILKNSGESYQMYYDTQEDLMFKDVITDLPNVTYYQRFAPGTLKQFLDQGQKPVLLFFDIQGMHNYNDRYGYTMGNALLKQTGKIIGSVFVDDFCIRYTEDHFIVITARKDYAARIEDVRSLMRAQNGSAIVDVNVGIYMYEDPQEDCTSAVDKARWALDVIHNNLNVHVCVYDEEVRQKIDRRNYVLNHYQDAIRNGWIKVYYQPLIGTLSGKTVHVEALSRWVDPVYGFMNPGEFIGILEEYHRLTELDLYVLDVVCSDIEECRLEGRPYCYASVNLSRNDLEEEHIHERINSILERHGVSPREIAIEITESAIVDHEEMIEEHIKRFHCEGYSVWLDDFGSGYSSFNALQNFDFDVLKIDMQFLRRQNSRTPVILENIVDMTKKLGMLSVTEGVETAEQSAFLKNIGCVFLQGFLYSKPMPKEELTSLLEKNRIPMEGKDDREFYSNLVRINVLNPDDPVPGMKFAPLSEEKSISIVVEENGKYEILYTNDVGQRWISAVHMNSLQETSRKMNEDPMAIHKVMKECMARLKDIGDLTTQDVNGPSFKGKMEVELISEHGGRRGFLVSCIYA
ncbi:MAG: GGDEF domain-containing phosphodiesterase [Bulleidia sp.]|nr:GGDEF domain-containing phosphodiesterase [Bulleidia sp.]